MKKAKKSDKEKVVRIICESFDSNPHVSFIVKNDNKKPQRMEAMAAYAFEMGLRRDGVWLTDDELGVSIVYEHGKVKMNLYEYWFQLRLVFQTFTLKRSLMVNKLENRIKKHREAKTPFLYLWFFGIAEEGLGTNNARDMMKFIFDLSYDQKLPVYLETSLKRNNVIYKRFGLQDYNMFETGIEGLTMWFMRRPYNYGL